MTKLRSVVSGPIGGIVLCENIAEIIWNELEKTSDDDDTRVRKCNLLLRLISYGMRKTTHCGVVDKKKLNKFQKAQNQVMQEIRNGIISKNLTDEQNRKLEKLVEEGIKTDKKDYFLGAKIRLRTGLESNVLCALKTSDFRKSEVGVWHLCIRRQVTNDGTEIRPLTRREEYRDVPCTDELELLLLEKNRTMSEDGWLLNGGETAELVCGMSPSELNRFCRELIKQVGIDGDALVVPDDKKGTVETNLIYYGDYYRETFRRCAAEKMGMTTGEIAYLLGVQATVTHERFYCDYSNSYKQLQMRQKLQRWEDELKKETKQRLWCSIPGKMSFNENTAVPETMELEFIAGGTPVSVGFDSKYGVNINLNYYEEIANE